MQFLHLYDNILNYSTTYLSQKVEKQGLFSRTYILLQQLLVKVGSKCKKGENKRTQKENVNFHLRLCEHS